MIFASHAARWRGWGILPGSQGKARDFVRLSAGVKWGLPQIQSLTILAVKPHGFGDPPFWNPPYGSWAHAWYCLRTRYELQYTHVYAHAENWSFTKIIKDLLNQSLYMDPMTDVVERSTYLVLLSGNIQKCPECSCGLDTAEETKDGPPQKSSLSSPNRLWLGLWAEKSSHRKFTEKLGR